MRITQTMMQNNMLNNLFKSQAQMDKYMTQIYTGKKIRVPSEDPVIAMKGMGYRTEVKEIEQYRRNASEVWNWFDHTDDTLDKATKVMQRVESLAIQGANDPYDEDERMSIAQEIRQLRDQLAEMANTNVNGKYIFNGTDTNQAPLQQTGVDGQYEIVTNDGRNKEVLIEVSKGINLPVNINPDNVFDEELFQTMDDFIAALETNDQEAINDSIGSIQNSAQKIINERAALGGRMNRLEVIEDRLSSQEVIAKDTMNKNEGVDFEEAVTNLLAQEVMHRAALSAGAKIIQPSLVDFLR